MSQCGTVAELCRRGYAERMVLSYDAGCHTDSFSREMLRRSNPNWHLLHVVHGVVSALQQQGVTDEQIH